MVSSFDLPSKVNSEERPFLKPGVISDHPRRTYQHQQKQGQGKNNDAPHVGRDGHSHSDSPQRLQIGGADPSSTFFSLSTPAIYSPLLLPRRSLYAYQLISFSSILQALDAAQIGASHGFLPSDSQSVSCPRFRAGWQILPVFPGCHLAGRIPHPALYLLESKYFVGLVQHNPTRLRRAAAKSIQLGSWRISLTKAENAPFLIDRTSAIFATLSLSALTPAT